MPKQTPSENMQCVFTDVSVDSEYSSFLGGSATQHKGLKFPVTMHFLVPFIGRVVVLFIMCTMRLENQTETKKTHTLQTNFCVVLQFLWNFYLSRRLPVNSLDWVLGSGLGRWSCISLLLAGLAPDIQSTSYSLLKSAEIWLRPRKERTR